MKTTNVNAANAAQGQLFIVGQNFAGNRSAKFQGFAHTAPQFICDFVDAEIIAEYKAWLKKVYEDNYYTIVSVTKSRTNKNGKSFLSWEIVKVIDQSALDVAGEFMDRFSDQLIALIKDDNNTPKRRKSIYRELKLTINGNIKAGIRNGKYADLSNAWLANV